MTEIQTGVADDAPRKLIDSDRRVPSKRPDRRTVRTRESIVTAGITLFAERGLQNVSIDEIVEEASISKQTFYNYYNDKMSLANSINKEITDEYLVALRRINVGVKDPPLRMARCICFYAKKAISEPNKVSFLSQMLVLDRSFKDPINLGLMRDLEAGLNSGRFIFRTLEGSAAFIVGASEPMLFKILASQSLETAITLAQDFLTMILRGLAVPTLDAELIAAQAANQIIRQRPDYERARPAATLTRR